MIVEPDFPDHWKTRHVVKATGSEAAVRCILRLWAYCQTRHRWIVPELTASTLSAICCWEGKPKVFWDAMVGTFIDETEAGFVVHEWEETNAGLIANWANGKKGGRPRKEPVENPRDTHGEPKSNPSRTDMTGEDKKRGEKTVPTEPMNSRNGSSSPGRLRSNNTNAGARAREADHETY